MAIIRSKSLPETDIGELKNKLKDLRLELMKFSTQRASKSVSNPGKMKEIRRSIAKILTSLNLRGKQEVKKSKSLKHNTKTK